MADPPEKHLLELEREQWHRTCRSNLIAFCIQVLSGLSQKPARHHRFLCEKLMALVNGTLGKSKLMILAPPGSSKTTYTSRLFPSWFFAARPNTSIIAVSHTASLAITNSGHVRRIVGDHAEVLAYSLLNDAGDDWSTSNGCEYHARGALQAVRGLRADLIILDDPITDKADRYAYSLHVELEVTWRPLMVHSLLGQPIRRRHGHQESPFRRLRPFALGADACTHRASGSLRRCTPDGHRGPT